MNLHALSATEAAARLRAGDVSAEDYARALLDRCAQAAGLNAFIALAPEEALAAARAADARRRRGEPLGPLHGVPLAVKDVFDVAGTPTTAGTPALADHVPPRTAPIVERLLNAGALLLGRTNLHELCYGITSGNEFTGAVRNPYDPQHSPGGSSGGTAAAVAARLAPAGLGTDTSGSIRLPAAHCGVVGFRPSTGRYPGEGIVPMNRTRDAPGLMARTVADVVLLDTVITGAAAAPPATLRGLRLGVPRDAFFAELEPPVAVAVERELERLAELGVTLVEAPPPDLFGPLKQATGVIMAYELPRDLEAYLRGTGSALSFADVAARVASPYVRAELDRLASVAGPGLERRYAHAVAELVPDYRRRYEAYLRDHRLAGMVLPTSPLLPPPVGENDTVEVAGRRVSIWRGMRNAVPATMAGAPALSLPASMTPQGLPVGLEIDGVPGEDAALLGIGLAWERTREYLPAAEGWLDGGRP